MAGMSLRASARRMRRRERWLISFLRGTLGGIGISCDFYPVEIQYVMCPVTTPISRHKKQWVTAFQL